MTSTATIERGTGPAAVERVYREVLGGRSRPDTGPVLSLLPDASS